MVKPIKGIDGNEFYYVAIVEELEIRIARLSTSIQKQSTNHLFGPFNDMSKAIKEGRTRMMQMLHDLKVKKSEITDMSKDAVSFTHDGKTIFLTVSATSMKVVD